MLDLSTHIDPLYLDVEVAAELRTGSLVLPWATSLNDCYSLLVLEAAKRAWTLTLWHPYELRTIEHSDKSKTLHTATWWAAFRRLPNQDKNVLARRVVAFDPEPAQAIVKAWLRSRYADNEDRPSWGSP